jgi:hypothetical protein
MQRTSNTGVKVKSAPSSSGARKIVNTVCEMLYPDFDRRTASAAATTTKSACFFWTNLESIPLVIIVPKRHYQVYILCKFTNNILT